MRALTASGCALKLGESTHLRLLEQSDALELHALIEANREQLARWLPWAATQSLEDTRAFIGGTREQAARNDGFQVAVVQAGRIAGVIGYVSVDWDERVTSIGYWLGEEFQGQGTMTAGARLLTDHALVAWSWTGSKSVPRPRTGAAARFPSASTFARRGSCLTRKASAAACSTGSPTRCWRPTGRVSVGGCLPRVTIPSRVRSPS